MPFRFVHFSATLLAIIGSAGFGVAQTAANPATIDQLSIPATPTVTPRRPQPWPDAATIAAQDLELKIQEAEDTAFAAALLDALLNNHAPSHNPLVFIPRPPAVFSSYLTEEVLETPQRLSAQRPPTRPAGGEPRVMLAPPRSSPQATPPEKQSAGAAPDCGAHSLSWSPACTARLGEAGAADDAEIKTLDDGVYVKN